MQEVFLKGDDVDQTAVVSPASKKGEGHTLRAMMEAARRGPIADNGLIGQPSYRPYPAPVMTGTPSGYYSSQRLGGREKASMFGINRHKTFSFCPGGPDDTSDFIIEGDGGFVVAAGLFDAKGPCPEAVWGVELFSVRDDEAGAGGDGESELTEDASGGVDAGGTVSAQGGTEAMESGESVLIGRFDGHGLDVLVAKGFEKTLGVTAIGFVSDDVGADGVGREEEDGVTEGLELTGPVVGGTAGLEDDGGGLELGEEAFEPGPREPVVLVDGSWRVRDGDFKDGLSKVDGDGGVMRHIGLLLHEK